MPTFVRDAADDVEVTDSVQGSITSASRTVDDSVAVVDHLLVQQMRMFRVVVSDTVEVTDSVELGGSFGLELSDSVEVTDLLAQVELAPGTIVISESATAEDTLVASTSYSRTASDSVEVTDAVAYERLTGIVINDTVDVTDAVFIVHDAHRIISDVVSVVEEVSPGSGVTAFTRAMGAMQGRMDPTAYEAPDGDFVFVLGDDREEQRYRMRVGDYVAIRQTTSSMFGFHPLRLRVRMRWPRAGLPSGAAWRFVVIVDGVEYLSRVLRRPTRDFVDMAILIPASLLEFRLELAQALPVVRVS